MMIVSKVLRWWRNVLEQLSPKRQLIVIQGDSLPTKLPKRNLVLAREGGEDWCVGMHCPCGCGHVLELLLIKEAKPRWELILNPMNEPTLKPSIWLKDGCRSHFWVRDGRVFWCY